MSKLTTLAVLGLVASILELVPIEWLALGISLVAIFLAAFAVWRVTVAISEIDKVASRQTNSVKDLREKAESIQQTLSRKNDD